MASKSKVGKAGAKAEVLPKKNTKIYEGALDNSYYVKAQMKNGNWYLARIIDCRLVKDQENQKRKKVDSCYEYYIHYENFNRRMDEWVSRNRIELTDQIIEMEPEIKKKKKTEERKNEYEENDEHEGMDPSSIRQHEEITRFKTITQIQIGRYLCETWYYSPFPKGYHNIDCLYLCEFCLSFYVTSIELKRHSEKCQLTCPPGDEIYRYQKNSVFEIDGHKNSTYCENLCYLSKLFLDHKNLYYDVEPFLFFILTENDENGCHIVGYFSKEKESTQGYNLSCILVLPFYQRKGYGKFLITFSYELSLKEQKIGTPERPLSDLGKESYLSWWTQRIIVYMKQHINDNFSIADISKETGIKESDIRWTLEQKNLIKYNMGQMYLLIDEKQLDLLFKQAGRPGLEVKTEYIHWVPFSFKHDPISKF